MPSDDRTSVFGVPIREPERDERVSHYLNGSIHKLHIAEWHRDEFKQREDELSTLAMFAFDEEPFLPPQAHADGSLIQVAAGFDAFACAVAHQHELDNPDRASFGDKKWNKDLVRVASEELGRLIGAIAEETDFQGLLFYRNLAAHRGVIGENQRGGSVDEVGPDGIRFMLPDWLPPEAPDLPRFSVRPVIDRYLNWARPKLEDLHSTALKAWGGDGAEWVGP